MSSGQCLFDPNYNGYTHYFSSLQKWSKTYISFHIANFHNTKLHPYSSFYMEELGECTVIGFAQSFYLKSNTFPVIKLWNNFSCALWVWNNLINNQTIKIIIRKWVEIVFHKNKGIESLMLHQKRTKHGCCRQMECGLIGHQYMHWIINVN